MGNNIKSHKIELRPTARQDAYLRKCAGVMRYTYNYLVAKWKSGEKYNRKVFQRHCVALRQATPWMKDVASRATYEAADAFNIAINNFFNSIKGKRNGRPVGAPSFKKKNNTTATVIFSYNTQFSVDRCKLKIPNLKSKIRMRESIRFRGQVKSVYIKQHTGKWYASFNIELDENQSVKNTEAQEPRAESVGVDLGIKNLAVLSTGEVIVNPKPLRKKLRLLRRRQRQVSRKLARGRKHSKRYKIAAARVSRLHKKVADQRAAVQHKFTSDLVKRFNRIVIEDLQVSNMLKNRRLARSISDAGWATIRWQLSYKSKAAGCELVVVDRFFASSKVCSCCQYRVEKLPLKQRVFVCPSCNYTADRDVNAALNLNIYNISSSPPIKGRRKTDAVDLNKTKSQDKAELLDGVNTNHQPEVSAKLGNTSEVVVY